MRLHRLTVTAFGPFAGRVEVDLDAVAEGGIFLIRGATGAGKTSLLDAICFALYADVPGARGRKGLHSDHAEAGAAPSVVLELTASGRRLRIERSPEFRRPKTRGSGEVTVPAKAQLWELRDDEWAPLSTRHDEIAEVVDDVLGMGLAQFSRVVLLPQGGFAAFLRATPEERRSLLERLFDVAGYVGVEEWFAEQRRLVAAEVEQVEHDLATTLTLLSEHLAGAPLPATALPSWAQLPPAEVPPALAAVVTELEGAASQAMTALDEARATADAGAAALTAARSLAAAQERGNAATTTVDQLDATTDVHTEALRRLDEAARAAAVTGELAAHDRSTAALDEARSALEAAMVATAALGVADRDAGGVASVLELVEAAGAGLHDTTRDLAALARLAEQRSRHRRQADEHTQRWARAEDELAAQVERRRRLGAQLDAATADAAAVETARHGVEVLSRHRELRREQDRDTEALGALRSEHQDLLTFEQELRQRYLDRREARLEGMAAELASRLEDGIGCPVCGAQEHPHPARAADAVTAEQVRVAELAWQEAQAATAQVLTRITALEATTAQRAAELGTEERTLDELSTALADRRRACAALEASAGALPRLGSDLSTVDAEVQRLTTAVAEAREAVAVAGAGVTEADEAITATREAVAAGLGAHAQTCPCSEGSVVLGADADSTRVVRSVVEQHDRARRSLRAHHDAATMVDERRASQEAAERALRIALQAAGFGDVDAARRAALPQPTVEELRALVAERDRSRAVAEAALADEAVAAALAEPAPDLEAAAATATAAAAALSEATSADTLLRATLATVRRSLATVSGLCDRFATASSRHAGIRDLADTIAGSGPNNELRMRLSAFVLAARLEKVADLANERLVSMGDGRYRLRHTDGRAARGARSGLGLEVLDLWTGQSRATTSLSGGESFIASLALALGLADAVREESGGFDLQTLFVDEGFGTLDDESLEQVLDVLDGLREGGRAVGVVSHVAELRTRITSQVVVTKTEHGSTVRVTGSVDAAA